MSTPKKFYALSDTHTGDYPKEYTEGFANTKEVIFFLTTKARDAWLKETNLLTARALTREEARKYSIRDWGGDCMVRPVQHPDAEFASDYVVIRESRANI